MSRPLTLAEPEASAVADVLSTAGRLRTAEETARRAGRKKGADVFSHAADSPWMQAARAESHVVELRALINLRARRAGLDTDALLRLCDDVAAGRAKLPDGVEPMEP